MTNNLLRPNVQNFKSKLKVLKALSLTSKSMRAMSDVTALRAKLRHVLEARIRHGNRTALKHMAYIVGPRNMRGYQNMLRNSLSANFLRSFGTIREITPDPMGMGIVQIQTNKGRFRYYGPGVLGNSNSSLFIHSKHFGTYMQPFNIVTNQNGSRLVLRRRPNNYKVIHAANDAFK
jgi:hypothetical protein